MVSHSSPFCFGIIACCPTHLSFNYRRHVGIVNICFQETFEDPSLQLFVPRISSSGCACSDCHFGHFNRSFYYLLTYLLTHTHTHAHAQSSFTARTSRHASRMQNIRGCRCQSHSMSIRIPIPYRRKAISTESPHPVSYLQNHFHAYMYSKTVVDLGF